MILRGRDRGATRGSGRGKPRPPSQGAPPQAVDEPTYGVRGTARGVAHGGGDGGSRTARGVMWGSPQVLLAALAFVLAVGFAVTGAGSRVPPPPSLAGTDVALPVRTEEVRYVVVDARGLERPGFADVDLPAGVDDANARLTAALDALRTDLQALGVWPEAVPAPAGFVVQLDRLRLAVVDVPPITPGTTVDVGRELTVVRSLVATARAAAAADEVRVTVGGEERLSLWGKVAAP